MHADSKRSFWEARYSKSEGSFDWYQSWRELSALVEAHVPHDAKILQVPRQGTLEVDLGVGNSELQLDMAMSGYTGPIISVDFSPTAIADLSLKHEGLPMLQYEVADVRNMPQYPTAFFDAVLDKGTLDALMCGDQADTNVDDMLQEASRVLRPGGCLIEVTYGSPGSRLPRLGKHTSVAACPTQPIFG
eukprot:jgi/Astpho2/7145/Aster-01471